MFKVFEGMVGNAVKPLRDQQTKAEVFQTMDSMRNDKKNFPFLTPEFEQNMRQTFRENQYIPSNREGLKLLYEATLGRNIGPIIKQAREEATSEAYKNIEKKQGTHQESDEGTEGGKIPSEDRELIDEILNAPGGETLI